MGVEFGKSIDVLQDYFEERISGHLAQEDLLFDFSDEDRDDIVSFSSGYFTMISKGAFFAGLDVSPILTELLRAFEAGGFPCGWVGAVPEEGGMVDDCLRVLHLGAKV